MNARRTLATLTATTAALGGLALIAPAADASGGTPGVQRTGTCAGATWKLKAKPDDGRIEVEGEIDSNRSGQVWSWRLKHNGSVSAKGRKKTGGASGSFQVERRMANLAGPDHFVFRAEHAGQVCRGTISF